MMEGREKTFYRKGARGRKEESKETAGENTKENRRGFLT
jgi:hypothetical protein